MMLSQLNCWGVADDNLHDADSFPPSMLSSAASALFLQDVFNLTVNYLK